MLEEREYHKVGYVSVHCETVMTFHSDLYNWPKARVTVRKYDIHTYDKYETITEMYKLK